MRACKFWYNDGSYDQISESGETLSSLFLGNNMLLHLCWRASGSRIPFYPELFSVLLKRLPDSRFSHDLSIDKESFLLRVKTLLHKNRIFKGSLVHIIFKSKGDKIKPARPGLFILNQEYQEEKFIINNSGLNLGLVERMVHPGFKVMESLVRLDPFSRHWRSACEPGIDSIILTNASGNIVECDDSSIFLVGGDRLYTPSPAMGGVNRAIRNVILSKAPDLGLEVMETRKLLPGHLNDADEVFIANDIEGIKWVVGFGKKRFFRKYSSILVDKINRDWEQA